MDRNDQSAFPEKGHSFLFQVKSFPEAFGTARISVMEFRNPDDLRAAPYIMNTRTFKNGREAKRKKRKEKKKKEKERKKEIKKERKKGRKKTS